MRLAPTLCVGAKRAHAEHGHEGKVAETFRVWAC